MRIDWFTMVDDELRRRGESHHGLEFEGLPLEETATEEEVMAQLTLPENCSLTFEEIRSLIPQQKEKMALNEVHRTRQKAYPQIGEQLDMIWHAISQNESLKTQFREFYESVQEVKKNNPKPK